jgi:His/Glu/Gln/Arg/opine family amino acid ABC transporter permease subunit
MATVETTPSTAPPDVRGPTAPLPWVIFLVGLASLALVILGPLVIMSYYGFVPHDRIVLALKSDTTAVVAITAIIGGVLAVAAGLATYRGMPTRRQRNQAVGGAVLGIQAVVIGAVQLWFRAGEVEIFVLNFFKFDELEGSFRFFLTGAKNTIVLALVAESGGIVFGLLLGVLTLSHLRAVRAPARAYINFFRGTPLLWQLLFGYFGIVLGLRLGVSSFQAALVILTLNAAAYIAEIFRAGIQSIERGQMEAARSMGMSYLQAMRYAIVPQAFRRVIPPLMNEFVALIKDTSLIAVLGLVLADRDLLAVASAGYSETFNPTFYVAAALGYLIITLPLIRVVNWLESKLRSGLVGVAGAGNV